MRTHRTLFLAAGWLLAGSLAWAADSGPSPVEVSFVEPEKFIDFTNDYYDRTGGHDVMMKELQDHLAAKARGYLAEGQRLQVRFLDIDLAGEIRPTGAPNSERIRIVRHGLSPKATFEFRVINADGTVAREGRRELQDLGFMRLNIHHRDDQLRYDKELLTDWMRQEFKRT